MRKPFVILLTMIALILPAAAVQAHGTPSVAAKFTTTFAGGLEQIVGYGDISNTEVHPKIRCTAELFKRSGVGDPWQSIDSTSFVFEDSRKCSPGTLAIYNCARDYKVVATFEAWGYSQGWHDFTKDHKIKQATC